MILFNNFARFDVGDGSAITSFQFSDGTPSAPGALLLGVSASAWSQSIGIRFSHLSDDRLFPVVSKASSPK
ncbi:hypothetical protein AYI69_g7429 [Smittium culicis]|uniref:Uncharacterized protein n=1 Tax=Smittium culicis TaxID=133412 RepID=A0A1R1XSD0_9FUNG|nr:hypothetical protein AYI69_g7429 [Smittium culicis]